MRATYNQQFEEFKKKFQPAGQQGRQQVIQQPYQQQQHQHGGGLDAKTQADYRLYFEKATPGQFKPNKLYVLFNDKTSVECINAIRNNVDLDKRVEIIDAARVESRPPWLKGVPTLQDDERKLYLGPECVMWIRYQISETLASVNDSTGTAPIMQGMPHATDGIAKLSGTLNMTTFVPQQVVSDRDLMATLDQSKADQRFETINVARQQVPIVAPPPGWSGQQQGGNLPEGLRPEQVTRGKADEVDKMNSMMDAIQNDRNALLNRPHVPHHLQQKAGWNPIETERVTRQTTQSDKMLAQLQQQRDQLTATRRPIMY